MTQHHAAPAAHHAAPAHAAKPAAPAPKGGALKAHLKTVDAKSGAAALAPGHGDGGGHPLLRKGSRGAAVSHLQTLLKNHGASPGAVDGDFGPKTLAAVKHFQSSHHLGVDGVVGPHTWAALDQPHASEGGHKPAPAKPGAKPTPAKPGGAQESAGIVRMGCVGAQVKLLQNKLKEHGHSPGAIDSEFGPKTLAALKAFQRQHHLEVDGIAGAATWGALGVHYNAGLTKLPAGMGGGGGAPSGGHGQPGHSSGDPVELARSFVTNPPTSSIKMKGVIPNFTAAGGQTNDCADFVSAILQTCGRLSGHHINVGELEGSLKAQGWHQVSMGAAKPGDVWINYSRGHTQLVATHGATRTIGSNNDRKGHQVISERAGYGAVIYHREFKS